MSIIDTLENPRSLLIEALAIIVVSAGLFGGGYYFRYVQEQAQERKDLAVVRTKDAKEVQVMMGVEKKLQQSAADFQKTSEIAMLAVTFVQPTAKAKPNATNAPLTCDPDPHLSLDAVRLLNAARQGTSADAQRILNAARRRESDGAVGDDAR